VSAADHAAALAAARRERPSLIVVDWNLPGVDTPRLLRDLRAVTAATIILATGATLDEQEARKLGADQLLRKPYSIDSLLSAAREASAASPAA
jgi:DNA-binding response OmpR family regulator